MGGNHLEAAILAEAKSVTKKSKLRQKDIMEWCTKEIEPEKGEKVFYLPELGVYASILVSAL